MPTRRDFILGTAATAAAVLTTNALGQNASSSNPPGGRKLGYAIVGIGSLASNQIIPALANTKSSKLVALVTGHPDKAPPIVAKFGLDPKNVYSYENFDKIASNPAIDVVYIVLPNGMHPEYTIRAFEAGKHVFCEKPMANSSADCQKMINAGKAAKRKLMIGYRCLLEPHNRKAIEICRSGQFGKTRLIIADHGWYANWPAWRLEKKMAGGGALMDIGIYSLSAARYLTGEEPISISAQQVDNPSDPRFQQVEEAIVWTMKFPSGAMATCTTSYNISGANHIRVIFERGVLDMEPATSYTGINLRAPGEIPIADVDEFATEMDHFSNCIINNTDPIAPGEEGLRDMKLIEAIYESARTGKTISVA